jgi:hypothetical protein
MLPVSRTTHTKTVDFNCGKTSQKKNKKDLKIHTGWKNDNQNSSHRLF